jgi:hypothetical protein
MTTAISSSNSNAERKKEENTLKLLLWKRVYLEKQAFPIHVRALNETPLKGDTELFEQIQNEMDLCDQGIRYYQQRRQEREEKEEEGQ